MKVRMRYLGRKIARRFGSDSNEEIVRLPDSARYGQLSHLLEEKYKRVAQRLPNLKWKEKMLESFIFICDGRPLRTIKDKVINPNGKILVGYLDFGG